ncbi:hypothetical protein PMAYCL1PPCAC_26768, partial [Pristionchus mayeri]
SALILNRISSFFPREIRDQHDETKEGSAHQTAIAHQERLCQQQSHTVKNRYSSLLKSLLGIDHFLINFVNRLSEQNESPLNQTYTIDTTKKMRDEEFTIDDAVTGFKPRARSSLSFKLRCRSKEPSSRNDQSLFSASCKLPRLGPGNNECRATTFKPWCRAQADLSKFNDALK